MAPAPVSPGVDTALVLARLAIGLWLLWSLPRLAPAVTARAGGVDRRAVSLVVPARDEAEQLPRLLASVPDDVEVVVVDDGSRDATAAVAKAHGARVVHGASLPEGWVGKPWACAQGAEAASGSVLVFVDADVRFGPDGLDRVLATLVERGGLVSVQPFHEPGSPIEHLAALFNVVAVAGTDLGSPLGRRAGVRGAFGPVLATRREDHDRAGGHRAVRSSVLDDVDLADAYRQVGLPVTIRAGGDAIAFRMYPAGFRQLVEGFTKNLAAGSRSSRPVTAALVVAWMTLLVQAALAPALALLGIGSGPFGSLPGAVALYLVVATQLWWMARQVGRFGPLTALVLPLHVGVFLFVFARSVVRAARGSVSWRGRRIRTRDR